MSEGTNRTFHMQWWNIISINIWIQTIKCLSGFVEGTSGGDNKTTHVKM